MVSFRLSKEEYDRLRDLCLSNGVRSVSEMARAAISLLLRQPERALQESLETRVNELEGRVHMLAFERKRLHHPCSAEHLLSTAAASGK